MAYQGENNATVKAKCPYFQRDSRKQIRCEGVMGSECIHIEFKSEAGKNSYEEDFCLFYPNGCSLCLMHEEDHDGKNE